MNATIRYSYAFDCLIVERAGHLYYFKDWPRLLSTMKHIASLDRKGIAEADAKVVLTEPPERIKFLMEQWGGEVKRPAGPKKTTIDLELEIEL